MRLLLFIGNTTPIAQEHEGMSCLVGGSLDWFLIDGNKDIEVVQVEADKLRNEPSEGTGDSSIKNY